MIDNIDIQRLKDLASTSDPDYPMRAAYAKGWEDATKRVAQYVRTSFERCSLKAANGYLTGDDVAAAIERSAP